LGVRQLKEFNIAFLRKWCWRMLADKGGLWFRMLASHYGVERGCLREVGKREIVRIRDGIKDLRSR
jgi:hypothetical protein